MTPEERLAHDQEQWAQQYEICKVRGHVPKFPGDLPSPPLHPTTPTPGYRSEGSGQWCKYCGRRYWLVLVVEEPA